MNVLISVDMEGIAGVVLPEHTTGGHREYERFRRLMTAEANAAVDGAASAGADGIVVNDAHGTMTNILLEELDSRCELISGRPKESGALRKERFQPVESHSTWGSRLR